MRNIVSMGQYAMEKEVLGKGNFARVELATHKLTGVKIAMKIIDTRKLMTSYLSRNLYREAKILARIRHPHIVRLYETLKASFFYCLVLEYVPGGDLSIYLQSLPEKRLGEREAWPMVRQITSALYYMHSRGIVHRDLKMDNILMDERKQNIKIVDFGLSNMFKPGELLRTHCGSPEFAAPELFQDRHDYGSEVDAWSFGVIIYGMVVGSLPFTPGSTEPSKRKALLNMLNKGLVHEHKSMMNHLSIDLRSLLLQLIEPKPELRMPLVEVSEHVWITKAGTHPLGISLEPPVDQNLRTKVHDKLSHLNKLDLETVQGSAGEYEYGSISAQYNMLMDKFSALRRDQTEKRIIQAALAKQSTNSKLLEKSKPKRTLHRRITATSSKMASILTHMGLPKDESHIITHKRNNGVRGKLVSVPDMPTQVLPDTPNIIVSDATGNTQYLDGGCYNQALNDELEKEQSTRGPTKTIPPSEVNIMPSYVSGITSSTGSTDETPISTDDHETLPSESHITIGMKAEALVHQSSEDMDQLGDYSNVNRSQFSKCTIQESGSQANSNTSNKEETISVWLRSQKIRETSPTSPERPSHLKLAIEGRVADVGSRPAAGPTNRSSDSMVKPPQYDEAQYISSINPKAIPAQPNATT